MNRFKHLFLGCSLVVSSLLLAEDSLDVDSMLLEIKNKSDLSEKTKLENSGISFVYTRSDLERMQIHYLKDLIKLDSGFSYNENRYGLPDPMMSGDMVPYMSSLIKVYVDNQEITAGMYGSGLIIFGDINMGFVDHVEVYTLSPTYEFSAEPTVTLIKMYSKTAQRDEGSKIMLDYDSNSASKVGFYNTGYINDEWLYFAYGSYRDDKREKIKNKETDLSRDKTRAHVFMTLSSEKQHFLFNATRSNRDAFIGLSLDATPEKNTLKSDSLHIGYDGELDNFSLLLSYDYLKTDHDFLDDVEPMAAFGYFYPVQSRKITSSTDVLTAELKYKLDYEKHHFVVGVRDRQKWYEYPTYMLNGIVMPERENKKQIVISGYIEDQYSLQDNIICNFGIQYLDVENPNARYNKNYKPLQYRYGLTYLQNNFVAKFIGSYVESYLEPYIVDSTLLVQKEVKGYKQHNFYLDFIYTSDNARYELIGGRSLTKNYLFPDASQGGLLDAYATQFPADRVIGRYSYNYGDFNKIFVELSYLNLRNIPTGSFETSKAVFRTLNSYDKLDFYATYIIDRAYDKSRYYDFDIGVSYNIDEDFKLSLQGKNLLNKAKESTYIIQDTQTLQKEDNLYAPLYERKIELSMEYLF